MKLHSSLTTLFATIAGLLLAQGCSTPADVGSVSSAVTGNPPARGFFEFNEPAVGETSNLESFMYLTAAGGTSGLRGTPFLKYAGNGTATIWVQESSGTNVQVAPAAFYYNVAGSMTSAFRFICASTMSVSKSTFVGPAGTVLVFNSSTGSSIQCWSNVVGQTTWTGSTIASSSSHALWLVAMAPVRSHTNQVDVAFNDDEFWDPYDTNGLGRTGKFLVRRATYPAGGGTPTVAVATDGSGTSYDEGYFDSRASLSQLGMTPPVCNAGDCGVKIGVPGIDTEVNCGPAPGGSVCGPDNRPASSCTPVGSGAACAPSVATGAQATGDRSNGCGGVIACAACPGGKANGGGGEWGFCGSHMTVPTDPQVRAKYGDTNNALCGAFADPLNGGATVVLATPTGHTCVNNYVR